MTEHDNDPTAPIDLSEVAAEPAEESIATEEDAVEGEPGWESRDEGGAVPNDAQ